jgi:hypothetical protein
MIWGETPATFTAENVDQALAEATPAEREPRSLSAIADALKQRGEAIRAGAPHNHGSLLIADGLACDLMFTRGESTTRWGPLGPMMEFDQGVYPPPIDTFPDALRPYFEQRAATTSRPDLRARYHDLIWLRWKGFASARAAHAAYLEAASGADLDEATSAMTACDYLISRRPAIADAGHRGGGDHRAARP